MKDLMLSTGAIALAEMGDKTQFLSLCLAACYRRPVHIIAGLFIATFVNHALAGAIGHALGALLTPHALQWIVGASFAVMAAWVLVPDKMPGDPRRLNNGGVLVASFITFFIAEMGDKTQIATMVLAAKSASVIQVVVGTTLGMMIASVPVVVFGDQILKHVPLTWIRAVAAGIFAVLSVLAFMGAVRPWL